MQKTEQRVRNAIEQLDGSIDAEVQKVEKQMEIIERGVMHTPAVAVDGDIETEGEVPGVEQLVEIFQRR